MSASHLYWSAFGASLAGGQSSPTWRLTVAPPTHRYRVVFLLRVCFLSSCLCVVSLCHHICVILQLLSPTIIKKSSSILAVTGIDLSVAGGLES